MYIYLNTRRFRLWPSARGRFKYASHEWLCGLESLCNCLITGIRYARYWIGDRFLFAYIEKAPYQMLFPVRSQFPWARSPLFRVIGELIFWLASCPNSCVHFLLRRATQYRTKHTLLWDSEVEYTGAKPTLSTNSFHPQLNLNWIYIKKCYIGAQDDVNTVAHPIRLTIQCWLFIKILSTFFLFVFFLIDIQDGIRFCYFCHRTSMFLKLIWKWDHSKYPLCLPWLFCGLYFRLRVDSNQHSRANESSRCFARPTHPIGLRWGQNQ